VAGWIGADADAGSDAEAAAEAVGAMWERWTAERNSRRAVAGREILTIGGRPLTVLWQTEGGSLRALLADSRFAERTWFASLAPIARAHHVAMMLKAPDGSPVHQIGTPDGAATIRYGSNAALPWNLAVGTTDPPIERGDFILRRRWLGAGFVLLASMAIVAGGLIGRAVTRELAVARLQSDFVAAVSHEFRTPLTALRQFTEMLREQPALSETDRHNAYEIQARATERLTRLVESLLDFGSMEAGARVYRLARRDGALFVDGVVADFQTGGRAAGHSITFHRNGGAPIDVDDEALGRALSNLLDNAVKYSPPGSPIDVDLHERGGLVFISVRDRGIGIPAHEQAQVFSKFFRGEQARARGIRGTGIGLAMVAEIARAHRGRVAVESEPGEGSTFTIVLPLGVDR
jgi:signal transduction histidine kinase